MVPENRLRRKLEQGKLAFGATTQIPAAALVEILGLAGFDFTMIDTEHGLYDIQTAGELIRTAQGAGLSAIVRVIANDRGAITKALDLGAEGVVVPHISTKEDAARAVDACTYGTSTGRGACPVVRAAGYGLSDWPSFQEAANRDAMVILLIEDLEGADNVEDILSVTGVDAVFLGPFDMSVAAGHQGNFNHPEVQEALHRILTACKERGIPVMNSLLFGGEVQSWADKGVRMFLQRSDSFVFGSACKSFLDSVSHVRERKFPIAVG